MKRRHLVPTLIGAFMLTLSCGDDGGSDGGDGGGGEPCDWMDPDTIGVDDPVTADAPSAECTSAAHFYRFTPPETGVYSLTVSGGGSAGFCDMEMADGCICAINTNCCSDCTLTFSLPDGSDLQAGTNYQIYVQANTSMGPYTITVSGPN